VTPTELAPQLTTALADRPSNSIQQLLTDAARQLLGDNTGLDTLRLSFVSTSLSATAGGIFEKSDGPAGVTSVQLRRGPAT
jgi:hypothetical protein